MVAEYPLSPGQQALWLAERLQPQSPAYNIARSVTISGRFRPATVERGVRALIRRHEALRTVFVEDEEGPRQRVLRAMPFHLDVVDARGWSEARLDDAMAEMLLRPFDLARGPLIRITAWRTGTKEHACQLAIHHMVADLWSLTLFVFELNFACWAARFHLPLLVPRPRERYRDFVAVHETRAASEAGKADHRHWTEELLPAPPALELPTDRGRPPAQSFRAGNVAFRLDAALTTRLRGVASAAGVNLHAVLLAAYEVLLARLSGQDDFAVCEPYAGRRRSFKQVMGYFVNLLALRADVAGDPPFPELTRRVYRRLRRGLIHGDHPFAHVVDALKPPRDLSRHPVFQVAFAWQKTTRILDPAVFVPFFLHQDGGHARLGGLHMASRASDLQVTPMDLNLQMAEAGGEVVGSLLYALDLFEPETARRWMDHYRTLLEAVAEAPDTTIGRLPLVDGAERMRLDALGAGEPVPTGAGDLLDDFRAQVARAGDAIALEAGPHRLSYRALDEASSRLARHLQRLLVGPEVPVGVALERSPDLVVALLAVLKAGGAWLPLDPTHPLERLAYVLGDAEVPLVLTTEALVERLPGGRHRTICLDRDRAAWAGELPTSPAPPNEDGTLAYVLYTSGSTGGPKGVMVERETLRDHSRTVARHFALTAGTRVLQFTPATFDPSLEQILPTLFTGGTVLLGTPGEPFAPEGFQERITALGAEVVNVTPAFWQAWMRDLDGREVPAGDLRRVIVGGDVMAADTLARWQAGPLAGVRLLNAYGPTEATITATIAEDPRPSAAGRVPIGGPLPGRRVRIAEPSGLPAPVGVPGELLLGGRGLARGYLGQSGLTRTRFITDPECPGVRLYRTGDRARWRPDGQIEYLGRLDGQVKVRGVRIETGEIEAVLRRHPSVADAVVALQDGPAGPRLSAFVTPAGTDAPELDTLRRHLRSALPEPMVPSALMVLDALPRGPGGKVDRSRLPAVPDPRAEGTFVAPRTELEVALAALVGEVLERERISVEDNFFDLGGHSLLATRFVSRLRQTLGVELPLRAIFEAPSVARLAPVVQQQILATADEGALAALLAEIEEMSDEAARASLSGSEAAVIPRDVGDGETP